ncbi:hypothetical protein Acr_04g0004580 [Actinidia rufa]|uniref:Uncharacterized protein n=1 Tax=Actinidia rufa TaxID=165716 RepID=A0A7J0EH63_9ERIC|nr:hypothetical protein Acr_04g0004580 [Actinidia rufa]
MKKRERNLRAAFWEKSKETEMLWKQKSRVKWIKEGDRNTRYFQAMANNRYRRNFLGSILVDGQLVGEPTQIKDEAVSYFSSIFDNKRWLKPSLGGEAFRTLTESDRNMLEGVFTEENVHKAVKECSDFKVPGPDGFNITFTKKAWNVMKGDANYHGEVYLQNFVEDSVIKIQKASYNPKEFSDVDVVRC